MTSTNLNDFLRKAQTPPPLIPLTLSQRNKVSSVLSYNNKPSEMHASNQVSQTKIKSNLMLYNEPSSREYNSGIWYVNYRN